MNIEEQKEIIIQRIKAMDDEQVIREVYEILNASEHHQQAIPLSAEQEWIVNESVTQYKAGKFISQDELEEKIDQWLGA